MLDIMLHAKHILHTVNWPTYLELIQVRPAYFSGV